MTIAFQATSAGRIRRYGYLASFSAALVFSAPLGAQEDEDDGAINPAAVLEITEVDPPVESAPDSSDPSSSDDESAGDEHTPPSPPAGSADDRFLRLQSLERAIWRLTGRVEELEYQLSNLEQQALDRYVELDRRISGENTGADDGVQATTSAAAPDSETGLYRSAFELMEGGKHAEAIVGFEELIRQYPNGSRVAESFFWLGELCTRTIPPQLEKARQQFMQVLNLYPEFERTPETMFKLGTVYHQLGDKERALEYLNSVVEKYPDHTVSRLATEYASALR